jgi:phage-Barnase-EndoU-ColicinE5/D-RelE like nuclease2
MATFQDYRGASVRLTDERLAHILSRHEMRQLAPDALAETLLHPEQVVLSRSDSEAQLYYRHHAGTPVGDKFLCVVVADRAGDAFVLTAYLTDSRKSGEVIWPEES